MAFSFGVASVSAYSTSGYKWSGTSTSYYIQTAFASSFKTAMKASDATWDAAGADFSFSYAGTTTRNPNVWSSSYTYDGHNDIGYYYNSASTSIASTTTWRVGTTIIEADTTFNTYYGHTTVGAAGKHDIQNTMTHEFGHWLRLLDVDISSTGSPDYCNSSSESTMCSEPKSVGDTNMRSLRTDDKNGIKSIYGT